MRLVAILLGSFFLSACNSSSPTAPTPVAPTPPPVVVVPPAPPPTPQITNYAGRWQGSYIVEECAGNSGSMDDILCSAPRPGNSGGIFQRGAAFPIAIELTQNGSAVTGILSLGTITGTVTGIVRSDQRLSLSGTVIASGTGFTVTSRLTEWDTFLSGGRMDGRIGFDSTISILPGSGVIRARLSNVFR